jgi:ubiquinone/menaquinone biosynthesis C-methylase UbiE
MLNKPKDNFSAQAGLYARYRPLYPQALYDFLYSHISNFDSAWDCATGNGQVAVELATRFANVYATDISQNQLDNAVVKENIHYFQQRAEHTDFADGAFSLVTVAQALHWFNFDAFNAEVKRVLKPGGYGVFLDEQLYDKATWIERQYFSKVLSSHNLIHHCPSEFLPKEIKDVTVHQVYEFYYLCIFRKPF